jgi:hypothetical protein
MELIRWSMGCMWCEAQTTTFHEPDNTRSPEMIVAAHNNCLGKTPEQIEEELDEWRMTHGFAYVVEEKRRRKCTT